MAIGGSGEDRESGERILRRVTELARGGADRVAILPTASGSPEEKGALYVRSFLALGVRHAEVLDVRTPADARDDDFVRRVEEADVVLLTGGDPLRLTSVLGGSPVLEAIRASYLRGGVVVGVAAGATALGGTMMLDPEPASGGVSRRGRLQMTPGLGLLDDAVLDTSFIDHGHFIRLLEAIGANPQHVGLGIARDTATLIRHGRLVEVVGRGPVFVLDGHEMRSCNVSALENGRPLVVEHMIVHTLAEGYGYDLERQRYLHPKEGEEAPGVLA